jgi:hypothetical protein
VRRWLDSWRADDGEGDDEPLAPRTWHLGGDGRVHGDEPRLREHHSVVEARKRALRRLRARHEVPARPIPLAGRIARAVRALFTALRQA